MSYAPHPEQPNTLNNAPGKQQKRLVLLHGHMFKNAGTSVDKILGTNFGDDFVDHREDLKMRKEGGDYVINYLRENPHIKALSSHHLPLPISSTDDIDFLVLIMLRHPIVRIGSVYRFEHIQVAGTPGAKAAKKYNFKDYIRWRLDERPEVISNYFVRYCTSALPVNLGMSERFKIAMELSQSIYVTGLVEYFDRSMSLLKEALLEAGVDFRVVEARDNVTDRSQTSIEEKLESLQDKLGVQLYDELVSANRLDLDFYAQIKSRFAKN